MRTAVCKSDKCNKKQDEHLLPAFDSFIESPTSNYEAKGGGCIVGMEIVWPTVHVDCPRKVQLRVELVDVFVDGLCPVAQVPELLGLEPASDESLCGCLGQRRDGSGRTTGSPPWLLLLP